LFFWLRTTVLWFGRTSASIRFRFDVHTARLVRSRFVRGSISTWITAVHAYIWIWFCILHGSVREPAHAFYTAARTTARVRYLRSFAFHLRTGSDILDRFSFFARLRFTFYAAPPLHYAFVLPLLRILHHRFHTFFAFTHVCDVLWFLSSPGSAPVYRRGSFGLRIWFLQDRIWFCRIYLPVTRTLRTHAGWLPLVLLHNLRFSADLWFAFCHCTFTSQFAPARHHLRRSGLDYTQIIIRFTPPRLRRRLRCVRSGLVQFGSFTFATAFHYLSFERSRTVTLCRAFCTQRLRALPRFTAAALHTTARGSFCVRFAARLRFAFTWCRIAFCVCFVLCHAHARSWFLSGLHASIVWCIGSLHLRSSLVRVRSFISGSFFISCIVVGFVCAGLVCVPGSLPATAFLIAHVLHHRLPTTGSDYIPRFTPRGSPLVHLRTRLLPHTFAHISFFFSVYHLVCGSIRLYVADRSRTRSSFMGWFYVELSCRPSACDYTLCLVPIRLLHYHTVACRILVGLPRRYYRTISRPLRYATHTHTFWLPGVFVPFCVVVYRTAPLLRCHYRT